MSKILLISHIFPPAIDGGSKVVYKLGQQFEARGHTTLYLSSNCASTDDFVNKYKVSLFKGKTGSSGKGLIKLPVYTFLRKPLKFINLFIPRKTYLHQFFKVCQKGPIFKFFPFLKATIKIIKFKPDLIVAGPLPTTIVLYSSLLKNIINNVTNFPSFLQRRGLRGRFCKLLINSSFHPTDSDFHQKPLIKALQSADYLWTLTQFETNYFIKNFHINPNKIILAGNGVDSDFLKNPSVLETSPLEKREKLLTPCPACPPKWRVKGRVREGFNILFIGSLSAHKRVDLLINSFSLLLKAKSYLLPAKLIIAGQKTLFYPQIKKTLELLSPKIKSNIKFIYNFPQNKLAKLIDNCTFLVLPSIQESFGLVLIESWARGKPVIASDIPPLSELIDQSHGGLTFKHDNLLDLQKQMEKLINSPEICYQYGQNGFKYVKTNYIWKKVSQKICQKLELF